MKFELNIDFLADYMPKKDLTKDDFKDSKALFNIFNTDGDNVLSSSEIRNIFEKIVHSSDTNKADNRANQYSIFDQKEAEHFINNNRDNSGVVYKDLGVSISQVYNFLKVLMNNAKPISEDRMIHSCKSEELLLEEEVIDDKTLQKADLLKNIPERKDQQFSEEERIKLAELGDEQLEQAQKLFFIEGRSEQFSANEIVNIITSCGGKFKVNDENYARLTEFLTLKDSAKKDLSAEDIVRLMTLPSDKIDKAIGLLTLENRAQNPLSMDEIVNIINCDSEELIDAVTSNPNLGNVGKTQTASQYWISVTDSSNNITYRHIKGQKYPEEISEVEMPDGNLQRTIYNKNLNIKQIMIMEDTNSKNPIRIETQHLSPQGNIEYTEVMEEGINPGTPDVYTLDSNGNKFYLQQTTIDDTTGQKQVTKRFSDDNGTLTEFTYTVSGDNEYNLSYNIKDKDGKGIFSREIELKKLNENSYEYKKDGKTYQIDVQPDKCVIIDKSDNSSHTFKYSDYISEEDNPDIFRQNILNVPADILIFLSKNPLSMSYGTKVRNDQGICSADHKAIDIGNITKTQTQAEFNDAFITILIHELGHYIDNPDLSEKSDDILSMNEDFLSVYREELEEFNKNHSTEEQKILMQFNGIGFQSKTKDTQLKRTATETFAESNMVSYTNSKNWTSARSYYLQRYFPRTIAKAQELLEARINDKNN